MRSHTDLRATLLRIDGRGYKAYQDIRGEYGFDTFTLIIDHVQGDPFASPSRVRVMVSQNHARFPVDTLDPMRKVALEDFLTRRFFQACRRMAKGNRGSGKSGIISIDRPGQEILERTSVRVDDQKVEARFVMGLPAFGRRVAGTQAISMIFEELTEIVSESLLYGSLDGDALYRHLYSAEDADNLRSRLDDLGLVAFVANGSVLPRASGVDPRPLRSGRVIEFRSPPSLLVEVTLPNRGVVAGMGIPRGVTLIVGGGYHGKSTLLNALELGIYNHIPGDGRELVVTDPTAVKIRAEDGRRIEKTDISPFITNLPFGRETVRFSTEDASGSTSQASNIMESLECGSRILLIDEDTSATNFMIRDQRMQQLVSKDKEPITPFVDKVRQLHRDLGVSTILVIGGSGDYFGVADLVICMVDYLPHDVTREAREIADRHSGMRAQEGGDRFGEVTDRVPMARSFDPSKGRREVKISSKGLHSIAFGTHMIDLGRVEQLVDVSQTRAVGDAIHYATRYMDGQRTLREIVEAVMSDISSEGLEVLSGRPAGDHAMFRAQELSAAINRLRSLEIA